MADWVSVCGITVMVGMLLGFIGGSFWMVFFYDAPPHDRDIRRRQSND